MTCGRALLLLAVVGGCGTRHQPPGQGPPPEDLRLQSLLGGPGTLCTNDGRMVRVDIGPPGGPYFCIDTLEASIVGGDLGEPVQGTDDADPSVLASGTTGATTAVARVELGVPPATGLTWWQAKAACRNAGKRLCTLGEWERACRGPEDFAYPYGNAFGDELCNGFFNYAEETPSNTGSLESCASSFYAYDLSGNVTEWVEDAIERVPGNQAGPPDPDLLDDRVLRGGSYLSNETGLACFGAEFHASPSETADDRGFRCCRDGE